MSLLGGGFITSSGSLSGAGSTDGDASGLLDTLEFGVALGSHPATALIGGMKSVAGDGSTALTTAGAESLSILSGASAAGMLATSDRAIAIGHDVTSGGTSSIVIGDNATANVANAVVIGGSNASTTQATGARAVVLGGRASGAQDSIAAGFRATASGGGAIAIGGNNSGGASASQNGAIAIGTLLNSFAATASAAYAISIGPDSRATAEGCIALGYKSNAITGTYGIAIGRGTTASGANSIVIASDGTNTHTASGANSIAIGNKINVSTDDAWQIRGFGLAPQAAAETDWALLCGTPVVMMSPEVDAKTATSNNRYDFPSGVRFFVESVDVIVTDSDTISVLPTYRTGSRNVADTAGDDDYFTAAALMDSSKTSIGDREKNTSLLNEDGVTSINGDVTVVATATTMNIRFAYKGYVVADE